MERLKKHLIFWSIVSMHMLFIPGISPVHADTIPVAGGSNIVIMSDANKNHRLFGDEFKENEITLDKENLTITITETEAKVEAIFWFKITSTKEQSRIVAFPLWGGVGTGISINPSSFDVTLRKTNAIAAGITPGGESIEEKAISYKHIPMDAAVRLTRGYTGLGASNVWSMSFPAKETITLKVRFTQPLFRDYFYAPVGTREFRYILRSCACWKGAIRYFEFTLKWEGLESWQRLSVENTDLWPEQSKSRGRDSKQPFDQTGSMLTVIKRNLEPTDFYIGVITMVAPGVQNPCPRIDENLQSSLSGKWDSVEHPVGWEKWVMIGNAYYDRGGAEKALKYYRIALEKEQKIVDYEMEAWLGMALIYEEKHEYKIALECFKKCSALHIEGSSKDLRMMSRETPLLYAASQAGIDRMEQQLYYFYK